MIFSVSNVGPINSVNRQNISYQTINVRNYVKEGLDLAVVCLIMEGAQENSINEQAIPVNGGHDFTIKLPILDILEEIHVRIFGFRKEQPNEPLCDYEIPIGECFRDGYINLF